MYLATWPLLFLSFLLFEINCQMSHQRELFHESNIGLVHQIKKPILKLRILIFLFFFFENEFSEAQRAANWHIDSCIDQE